MSGREMYKEEIMEYITNRENLFLIDHITEITPGQSAEGYLDCPEDAWFFIGHHPNYPIMPASVQIEALSQVFNLCFLSHLGKHIIPLLRQVKDATFYNKVLPGDRFSMSANLVSFRRGIAQGECSGYVNNRLVCKAKFVQVVDNAPDYVSRERKSDGLS